MEQFISFFYDALPGPAGSSGGEYWFQSKVHIR